MSMRDELTNVIWGHGEVSEQSALEIADAVIAWQAAKSDGGAVPLVWSIWMDFEGGKKMTSPYYYTEADAVAAQKKYGGEVIPLYTHPPADQWIRFEDRLPTMQDADEYGQIIGWDVHNGESVIGPPCDFMSAPWLTHWMPTGLKRPQPPVDQGNDNDQ